MNRVKKVSRLWAEHGREEHEIAVHTRRLRRLGRRTKTAHDMAVKEDLRARYAGMSRKDLLGIAKEAGIKGRTRMTKDRLVEALIR